MWVRSLGWEDPLLGHGRLPQLSCLENPMDRGAWRATVHGVTKSRTRLSDLAGTLTQREFDGAKATGGEDPLSD